MTVVAVAVADAETTSNIDIGIFYEGLAERQPFFCIFGENFEYEDKNDHLRIGRHIDSGMRPDTGRENQGV